MKLKMGIIGETLIVPSMETVYEELRSYLERTLKIPVENVEMAFDQVSKFDANASTLEDIDILFVTMDLSVFEHDAVFTSSSLYAFSETSIISANPIPAIYKSFSLFMIEESFFSFMLLHLVIVSLVIMLIKYYHGLGVSMARGRHLTWKQWSKYFFLRLMAMMWFFSNSFLFQMIPKIPRILSARLLCSGWLLCFQIIHIYLSCYLKSDLSKTVYLTIDKLSNLVDYPKTKVVLVEKALEERYFKRVAPNHPEYRALLEKVDYIKFDEILNGEFYEMISERKVALIFNIKLWKIMANLALKDSNKTNLYIGKDIIKSDPLVLPLNRKLSPALRENISLRISSIFECNAYRYLELEDDYRILWHSWEMPYQNEFKAASVGDFEVAYLLVQAGHAIAILTTIAEMVYRASKSGSKVRARKLKMKKSKMKVAFFKGDCCAFDKCFET